MVVNTAAGLRRAPRTDPWMGNLEVIDFDKDSFSGVAGIEACLECVQEMPGARKSSELFAYGVS